MENKTVDIAETVARNIRSARAAQRLTQTQLANACGVSRSSVTLWESAKRDISFENAARVADALGCELEDLRR